MRSAHTAHMQALDHFGEFVTQGVDKKADISGMAGQITSNLLCSLGAEKYTRIGGGGLAI